MKKKAKERRHYGTVAWYNLVYWLLNGFLLPGEAYSGLCALVNAGRFKSLHEAIREGIRSILDENASLLVRTDSKWMYAWKQMNGQFKGAVQAKPDTAGAENLKLLDKMYEAMNKST